MKKIISILLIIVILLSSVSNLIITAISQDGYTPATIEVDFRGETIYQDVFVNEEGIALLPADLLIYFGGMKRVSVVSDYVYSLSGSDSVLDRKIIINKNGSYGKTAIQIPGKKDLEGVSINFTDSYISDGNLYLPLHEIVPFLDAEAEITDDGILHIYPSPISIFEAINHGPYDSLYDVAFFMDDIIGGEVIGAMSLIIETIINLRLDRLDIIFDTGAVKDYSTLYEKILVENETYLAAFDKDTTPSTEAFKKIKDSLKEGKSFIKDAEKFFSPSKNILNYAKNSEKLNNYKAFAFGAEDLKIIGEIADMVCDAMDYADVTTKMVTDHQEMLSVVYEDKNLKKTPAGKAANEIAALYSDNTGKIIKTYTISSLRDYLVKEAGGLILKKLKPFTISMKAIKTVLPDLGDLSGDYDIFYLDTIVADSTKAFETYYNKMTFDETSLNDIRLSLLMTMVTSKYAYHSYTMFKLTDTPGEPYYNTARNQKYLRINEWLEKLYLSADSVKCCTPEHYSETKSDLLEDLQSLKFDNTTTPDNPDIPDIPASSEGLEFTWIGQGWSVSGKKCTATNVVIPNNYKGKPVISIDAWAFENLTSLTKVTIPDSVTDIGEYAFYGCYGLTSVTIPNSVTSIGYMAFRGCSGLTNITIPDSITSVGGFAFEGCKISYNEYGNAKYIGNKSNPYLVLVEAKSQNITSCEIHPTTKVISGYAFYNITTITNVTIPNNVTTIGDMAFYKCTGLKSIEFSKSITTIGAYAFSYNNFTSITLPDSLTIIDTGAFRECKSLTSIIIPDSVTSIGMYAFDHCDKLRYNEDNNAKYLGNDSNPYSALIKAKSENITSCEINPKTKVIANSAFEKCTSLTKVVIHNNVTSIGNFAFSNCSSLTSITIPDSVINIGDYAFYYSSLTSITIPDSVTSIGHDAFIGCSGLTSITFEGTVAEWNTITLGTYWNLYVPATEVICSNGTVKLK